MKKTILFVLLCSSIFLAQTKKEIKDSSIVYKIKEVELEEVVIESKEFMNKTTISVGKIPLKNIENPQVYSSISNVIMKKQIAMNIEDAMKNAAGVTKLWDATGRPDGGSFFTSRGFATTTKVRNGLVTTVNSNIDMANVERIEVIKGPSATLFGSIVTSYGGLINRVTKRPFFYTKGEVDLSVGQYNFYRGSADVNVPLNDSRTMAARFNASAKKQDSWQDIGFSENYSFAPSFTYMPNEKFELNVDAEIIAGKANSNGGNFIFFLSPAFINQNLSATLKAQGLPDAAIQGIMSKAPKTFQDAFGTNKIDKLKLHYDRSYASDDLFIESQNYSAFAEAIYKINDNWKSQTFLNYTSAQSEGKQTYQYLIPNYVPALITSLFSTGVPNYGSPGHDQLARMVWEIDGYTNSFNIQQNFRADYDFGKIRNRTVIGVDYTYYKNRHTYNRYTGLLYGVPFPDVFDIVPSYGDVPTYNELNEKNVKAKYANSPSAKLLYHFDNNVVGTYVNNVTNFTNYIILSFGLRWDHFNSNGRYSQVAKKFVNAYTQNQFSPKLGLIIMPLEDQLSIFANYQNGFTNKYGVDSKGNALIPEEANQFETGIKVSLLNDKIAGSLSYYDILVKNIVRPDINNPTFDIQDGEQSSKGIEAEISTNVLPGWILLLGYGYNDSKFVKAAIDVQGLRPDAAGPKHTLNFWTNYTFTKSVLKGFGIGLSINYSGEAYTLNQNPSGKMIIPAYVLIGSSFSYDNDNFKVALKINNLSDKKYWMGWTNMIPQMPRQFVGSIAYKF